MPPTTNAADLRIICGLGNPPHVAPEDSLHNLGFQALDRFVLEQATLPAWRNVGDALVCEIGSTDRGLLLVKPLHIDINSSGVPLRRLAAEFACDPSRIVVVYDDVELPPGSVRIKSGSSSDRHNGVRSIAAELQSGAFTRIRGGVGRPEAGTGLLDYVKGKMPERMRPVVAELTARLARAVDVVWREGVQRAQNMFNRQSGCATRRVVMQTLSSGELCR